MGWEEGRDMRSRKIWMNFFIVGRVERRLRIGCLEKGWRCWFGLLDGDSMGMFRGVLFGFCRGWSIRFFCVDLGF